MLLELLSVTRHAQMVCVYATAMGSLLPSVSLRKPNTPYRMNVECSTHVDSSQTHEMEKNLTTGCLTSQVANHWAQLTVNVTGLIPFSVSYPFLIFTLYIYFLSHTFITVFSGVAEIKIASLWKSLWKRQFSNRHPHDTDTWMLPLFYFLLL